MALIWLGQPYQIPVGKLGIQMASIWAALRLTGKPRRLPVLLISKTNPGKSIQRRRVSRKFRSALLLKIAKIVPCVPTVPTQPLDLVRFNPSMKRLLSGVRSSVLQSLSNATNNGLALRGLFPKLVNALTSDGADIEVSLRPIYNTS